VGAVDHLLLSLHYLAIAADHQLVVAGAGVRATLLDVFRPHRTPFLTNLTSQPVFVAPLGGGVFCAEAGPAITMSMVQASISETRFICPSHC
jgi:hypothetical protein